MAALLSSCSRLSVILIACSLAFVGLQGKPMLFCVLPFDATSSYQPGTGLVLTQNRETKIRLVGFGFMKHTKVCFTTAESGCGPGESSGSFSPKTILKDGRQAVYEVTLITGQDTMKWFLCLSSGWGSGSKTVYVHQGTANWLSVNVRKKIVEKHIEIHQRHIHLFDLPSEVRILICVLLLILSGLFNGISFSVMALDKTELEIILKVGSEREKKHAKKIFPLRKMGNFVRSSLLLGNVLVNTSVTLLLARLTGFSMGLVLSTTLIFLIGEILPQAICLRHGLAVGATTSCLTWLFLVATFPLSFPIGFILDKALGDKMGQVYNKEKLQELIRMTSVEKEVNTLGIIAGALQLTSKQVKDVMTKLDDVFMLDIRTVLNFETLQRIMHLGYTRIPVYEGTKSNIVSLLNTKHLTLLDPDDATSLATICKFYNLKALRVSHDVRLDVMLQEFLKGNSHMAIVQMLHNTEDQDPYYETVGVVTLEDVIEEILQSEIVDETDVLTDNREKKETKPHGKQEYGMFGPEEQRSKMPKQLAFVAYQFLTTNVEPFSDEFLARNVLKNLIKKDIVVNLTPKAPPFDPKNYIYQKGKPSDEFVLILQGSVEVTIGLENMSFDSGPFTYFGVEAINALRRPSILQESNKDYIPDFSVRAVTQVQYISIKRSHYIAALRTTKMMRHQKAEGLVSDFFDTEYEKVTQNDFNFSGSFDALHTLPNFPVETLKHDASPQKKSTSSLDHLPSTHHGKDIRDIVSRMRRSGSDARERAVDVVLEFDSLGRKHFSEVKAGKDSGNKPAPRSPLATEERQPSQSSLPFSTQDEFNPDRIVSEESFTLEEEGKEHSGKKKGATSPKTVAPYASSSGNSDQAGPSESPSAEGAHNNKSDLANGILDDGAGGVDASGQAAETVPLVDFKSGGDTHVVPTAAGSSHSSVGAAKDAERVPLIGSADQSQDTNIS